MVLYHCCTSLSRAREIAREGFSPRESVRVSEHLSGEHAIHPDDPTLSSCLVCLGISGCSTIP